MTWLGVSTALIEDGDTAILTDGFFSRPSMAEVAFTEIAPDPAAIERQLRAAGIERLDAVVVLHSHYDHVMDAPEVARRTGALLVGSESTANVARGMGLDEGRLRIIDGEARMGFGDFELTLIPSKHFPHGRAMGTIDEPLEPPARASEYLEGGTWSLLVEHQGRRMLVQSSAGFVEGALDGRRAEVVFLGVGGLGSKDVSYRRRYWDELVAAVEARRVIPVHWDDFTRPLSRQLVPLPYLLDDFGTSMDFLVERGRAEDVDVRLLRAGRTVDPFTGL